MAKRLRPLAWCLLVLMFILVLFGFRWDRASHRNDRVSDLSSAPHGRGVVVSEVF
jgi:uncharacterized membrane protein YccF (DUF307 family)